MVTLDAIYGALRNVKVVSIYNSPSIKVDLEHKERYEVVSVSSIYNKGGLHVRVKEIEQ